MKQKKLSETLARLRGFFTRGKKDRKLAKVLIVGLFATAALLIATQWYARDANQEIQDRVVRYHVALDQRDWKAVRDCLSKSKENDIMILNLRSKMDAIKVRKVSLKEIYPAIIHNDVAIVSYVFDVENDFNEKPTTIKEFAVRFFVKQKDGWKFASREDLAKYDESEKLEMLDAYTEYLKTGVDLAPFVKSNLSALSEDSEQTGRNMAEYQFR